MHIYLLKRIRKNLLIGYSKRAGKNFFGRKTIYTQSGGLKIKLYSIDFKRILTKNGMLLTKEKDYQRSGYIGLVCYENGIFGYILLSHLNYKPYHSAIYGFNNYFKDGMPTFLFNVPTGNIIHSFEYKSGNGCKISRAAGVSSFIISRDSNFSYVKLNSGWLLKLSNFNVCVSGNVSNEDHCYTRIKNAGFKRKLGFRPTVRGISKNPCDHPHGGGEGRGSPKKAQRTPWGKLTKIPTKKTKLFYLKKKKFKIFKKR